MRWSATWYVGAQRRDGPRRSDKVKKVVISEKAFSALFAHVLPPSSEIMGIIRSECRCNVSTKGTVQHK